MIKKKSNITLKLMIIAGMLGISDIAVATEWVRVNTGNFDAKVLDYDQYFYDRTKMITSNNPNEITYWRLVVFKKPRSYKNRFVKKSLIREKINCNDHTTKMLSGVYYDMNDTLIDQTMNVQTEPEAVIPNTIGDAYEQTMCKLIPPAPPPPPTPTPVQKPTETKETKEEQKAPLNTSTDAKSPPKADDKPTVSTETKSTGDPLMGPKNTNQPPLTPVVLPPLPSQKPLNSPVAPVSEVKKVKLQSLIQKRQDAIVQANKTGVSATVNTSTLKQNQPPLLTTR